VGEVGDTGGGVKEGESSTDGGSAGDGGTGDGSKDEGGDVKDEVDKVDSNLPIPAYKNLFSLDSEGGFQKDSRGNFKTPSGIKMFNSNNLNNPSAEVYVKFGAEWCAPCKALDRKIPELARRNGGRTFVTIDIDKQPGIARKYGYVSGSSIPKTTIYKGGKNLKRSWY